MKVLAINRRARHDYDLGDRYQAGIVLAGHEVKSIKQGQASLKGSFIHFKDSEAYLVNAHIRKYSQATQLTGYDPTAPRKLLLNRKELDLLETAKRAEGKAIIPTAIGLVRGFIKVELAVGRGRKHYDKRAVAKKKAMKMDAALEAKSKLNH